MILSGTITTEAQWAFVYVCRQLLHPNQSSPGPFLPPHVFPGLKTVSALWTLETEVLGWLQTQQCNEKTSKSGPVVCHHWNCDCAVGWLKDLMESNKKKKVLTGNSPITGVSVITKAGGGIQRQGDQHNHDLSVDGGQQPWHYSLHKHTLPLKIQWSLQF